MQFWWVLYGGKIHRSISTINTTKLGSWKYRDTRVVKDEETEGTIFDKVKKWRLRKFIQIMCESVKTLMLTIDGRLSLHFSFYWLAMSDICTTATFLLLIIKVSLTYTLPTTILFIICMFLFLSFMIGGDKIRKYNFKCDVI